MGFTIVENAGARLILATSARCRLFLLLLFTYKFLLAILLLQLHEFLLKLSSNLLCSGLSVDIVELVLVILKVKEFPNTILIEVDEFVTLGAHTKVTLHGMLVGVLIVVVIYTVAVGFPLLALKDRKE